MYSFLTLTAKLFLGSEDWKIRLCSAAHGFENCKVSSSYLDIAEEIIRAAKRPMSTREILAHAYISQMVPSHLHGRTQEKTLQARLSEDIARLREASLFFRTNRAEFFLREFIGAPNIPSTYQIEFFAKPRRKTLKSERVLAFKDRRRILDEPKILSKVDLDRIFSRGDYRYTTWRELSTEPVSMPVYSFVIFHNEFEILTHEVGQFNADNHPSKGLRSLGFGSVVRAQDGDLLYDAYHGIVGSAINELVYSLGLSRELAREARYEHRVSLHCGIASFDPRIGPHLRAIMSYRCPDDFRVSRGSLSLNRLAWIKPDSSVMMSNFDEPSQILLGSARLLKILQTP